MSQLHIPQLSPAAQVEQQIGLAKAIINYSRPSLRGRKLLGQSDIPYGKLWRLGANDVTTLQLSDDMLIEGKKLAKGKYAFVAIPEESEWTIVINSDQKQWGVYEYKESKDVMGFKVKAEPITPTVETLGFTFEDIQPISANIVVRWENVQFKVSLVHDCDAEVMADIKKKMAVPGVNMLTMMEAAEYYLMMNRDLEQALTWSEKVLSVTKSPFRFNLKAQIAHKMGKCEIAIEASKNAIEYAQKNGDAAAIALANSIIESCESKK